MYELIIRKDCQNVTTFATENKLSQGESDHVLLWVNSFIVCPQMNWWLLQVSWALTLQRPKKKKKNQSIDSYEQFIHIYSSWF